MSFSIITVVRQLKYRIKIDNNKSHEKYDNARRTLIYSRDIMTMKLMMIMIHEQIHHPSVNPST